MRSMKTEPLRLAIPIVDMLTGDEIQEAIVRFILERKGVDRSDIPLTLEGSQVQMAYRNVRFPDGTLSLFATVGIFAKPIPKVKAEAKPLETDTPVPSEKTTNG